MNETNQAAKILTEAGVPQQEAPPKRAVAKPAVPSTMSGTAIKQDSSLYKFLPEKSVVIDLTRGKSKATVAFKGMWSGKDITVVQRAISKEYKLYQRDIRRNLIKQTKEVGDVST